MIDYEEIIKFTKEYGGNWGINHTNRLLKLISIIGKEINYNKDAIWISAHLHDWGGYQKWKKNGINHAQRSKEVAEEYLKKNNYNEELINLILECIEYHHSEEKNRSIESILLSDADALDFLGIVGIFRDLSKNSLDLKKGYESSKNRIEKCLKIIQLKESKKIAKIKIKKMKKILLLFEKESFGLF